MNEISPILAVAGLCLQLAGVIVTAGLAFERLLPEFVYDSFVMAEKSTKGFRMETMEGVQRMKEAIRPLVKNIKLLFETLLLMVSTFRLMTGFATFAVGSYILAIKYYTIARFNPNRKLDERELDKIEKRKVKFKELLQREENVKRSIQNPMRTLRESFGQPLREQAAVFKEIGVKLRNLGYQAKRIVVGGDERLFGEETQNGVTGTSEDKIDSATRLNYLFKAATRPNYVILTMFFAAICLSICLAPFIVLAVTLTEEIKSSSPWLLWTIFVVLLTLLVWSIWRFNRDSKIPWHSIFRLFLFFCGMLTYIFILMFICLILWLPAWFTIDHIRLEDSKKRARYYLLYATSAISVGIVLSIVSAITG